MKRVLLILFSIISIHAGADDYQWFEINWISDREATEPANPVFQKLPENEREDALNLYGHMRLNVKDGFITTIYKENSKANSTAYSIMPSNTEEDQFEIIFIDSASQTNYVWYIKAGFCMQPSGVSSTDPFTLLPTNYSWEKGETMAERFKPNDN